MRRELCENASRMRASAATFYLLPLTTCYSTDFSNLYYLLISNLLHLFKSPGKNYHYRIIRIHYTEPPSHVPPPSPRPIHSTRTSPGTTGPNDQGLGGGSLAAPFWHGRFSSHSLFSFLFSLVGLLLSGFSLLALHLSPFLFYETKAQPHASAHARTDTRGRALQNLVSFFNFLLCLFQTERKRTKLCSSGERTASGSLFSCVVPCAPATNSALPCFS